MTNPDQARLDADVAELNQALKNEVAALKAQIAAEPQRPANSLDFSGLEGVIDQVRTGDNVPIQTPQPPIQSDDPSLAAGTTRNVAAIGPVSPSPFVDADNDGEKGADTDNDGEVVSTGTTNDQIPAQSSEATSTPATDAASVTSPPNEVTPSTEGQAAPADVNVVDPSTVGSQAPAQTPTTDGGGKDQVEGDSGHSGGNG